MFEINVNVRFPDLLHILAQIKKEPETPRLGAVVNDLVNRQPVLNAVAKELEAALSATDPNVIIPTHGDAAQPDQAPVPVMPTDAPVGVPVTVPTEAPGFTLAQISKAGADLLTAKPALQPQLVTLLAKYGAQTVATLKPEHFGAFATELRAMGGKI